MSEARTVQVATAVGGGSYPVRVGAGVLEELPGLLRARAPAHRYALISDETVAALHGRRVLERVREAGLRADLFAFPPGEEHKTRATWSELTDRLLEAGIARDGAVMALGGGVTGDLAGFVAATYMRGLPVVQLPTSLVAMIDASVGGKTGVDVPRGKNLVGAFHPPRFVVADVELAGSLPRAERAQGLAEAVKHGAILDRAYFEALPESAGELLGGEAGATVDAVARSVEIKAGVVSRDEREGGLRKILNFGHTLGHALEAAGGYRMGHGTAVALGMVMEARLGEALGITEPGTADALAAALEALELVERGRGLPPGLEPDRIMDRLGSDKKGREGEPRWVLLRRPGEVAPGEAWVHRAPDRAVLEVLEGFNV